MSTQNLYQTQDYFKQMHRACGDHAISGILFGIASIFQKEITKQTKAFPVLYIQGESATGKSTFASAIQKISNTDNYASFSFESNTKTSINKVIETKTQQVLCIEEYRSNERNANFIRNFWDRAPILQAIEPWRNEIKRQIEIKSTLIVVSREFPESENLRERLIFEELNIQKSAQFDIFRNMIHDENLNIKNFLKFGSARFNEDFKEEIELVKMYFEANSALHFISGRERLNITILLAVFKIFEGFDLFPFDYTDAVNHFIKISKR